MRTSVGRLETRWLGLLGAGFLAVLAYALTFLHIPPVYFLALLLGAGVVVGLVINPLVGVHVFVMFLYFENVLATQEGLTLMKLIGPLVLGSWILNSMLSRKPILPRDRFSICVVVFLAWCAASLFYADNTEAGLSRLATFAQLGIAALMFMSVVDEPGKMRGVIWAMVGWTTIAAVMGLTMYAMGLIPVVTGPGENRNNFAMRLVVGIVCAFLLQQGSRSRGLKFLVMFGLLPLLLVALALTLSRGGYISLMVAIALVWYRVARERRFLPVIAMIAILGLLLPFLPEAFWQRAESILPSVTQQQETFGKRLDLWELGLEMVRDRPILGVGVGNFTSVYEKYARGGMLATRLTAHNAYIAVAAEVGLIGLALFLILHGYALQSARSAIRVGHRLGRDDIRLPGTIFEVSVVAIMIMGLSGATEAEKLLWIIFGMVTVLGAHVTRLGGSAKPRSA